MAARSDQRKQFLFDVMVTAAEGGIGYWSQLSTYHWQRGGRDDLDGFHMVVHERDEQGSGDAFAEKGRRVDADAIARGLRLFGQYWQDTSKDLYAHQLIAADATNGQDGDYDSDLADQVVQFAIFGEIIYG